MSAYLEKRTEYGYAGMTREQALKAYMGLTCFNPPVPPDERADRMLVLRGVMLEEFAKEKDMDLVSAGEGAALSQQINALDDQLTRIAAAIVANAALGPGQVAITVGTNKSMLNVIPLTPSESAIILTAMRSVIQARRDATSASLTAL